MRIGDFAVEVVSRGKGIGVRETKSGHVLARPGQLYALRIRNFGPLRCVADVSIDGRNVSAGGLVIEAWCTEELERPISPDEDGRFTVVAEGDERVFGPDGGRDNADLGLISVRFRRELPGGPERARPLPPSLTENTGHGFRPTPAHPSRLRPEEFPTFNATRTQFSFGLPNENGSHRLGRDVRETASALRAPVEPARPSTADDLDIDDAERAAGTGLTGHSTQRFKPTTLGPLEQEATVIELRLVIASIDAITSLTSPAEESAAPARPAARP